MEQVLALLQEHGLTHAHIRKIVIYNPRLFLCHAHNNMKPKLSFLKNFMEKKDLGKLVSWNSRIMSFSLDHKFKPAVSFLQKCGFEGNALSRLLGHVPRLLATPQKEVLRLFKQVEDFGIAKESKMFSRALQAIIGRNEGSLQQKLQHLRNLGFSEEQVLVMCRGMPSILVYSQDKLNSVVDFLVDSAGLTLIKIARDPSMLGYSLKARAIPRYRVLEALKSMAVLESPPCFSIVLHMTDKCFLDKYVNAYPESSLLQDIYGGVRVNNDGLIRQRKL